MVNADNAPPPARASTVTAATTHHRLRTCSMRRFHVEFICLPRSDVHVEPFRSIPVPVTLVFGCSRAGRGGMIRCRVNGSSKLSPLVHARPLPSPPLRGGARLRTRICEAERSLKLVPPPNLNGMNSSSSRRRISPIEGPPTCDHCCVNFRRECRVSSRNRTESSLRRTRADRQRARQCRVLAVLARLFAVIGYRRQV